jgi:hypothetical protein
MPRTIDKTFEGQIIGGIFSNKDDADQAVEAFEELEIPSDNIEIIVQLVDDEAEDVYTNILSDRGFSEYQASYYDQVIREGKMLVIVYEVIDPAPIIDIFDDFKAEYNPNGSRDLREDVAGMTVGAAIGAIMGGPVGATAGAVAGAVVGGGSGAVAGKAVEHRK